MDSSHGGPLAATLPTSNRFSATGSRRSWHGHPDESPRRAWRSFARSRPTIWRAPRAPSWLRNASATPLILSRQFAGSLDAFPIEFGEIIDTHRVIFGADPFFGLSIRPEDLRRACEVQVKSHLLHLRENYIECGGRPAAIESLVADSAPGFAALLRRLASLDGRPHDTAADIGAYAAARPGLDPRVFGNLIAIMANGSGAGVDAVRLFPAYLAAVEQLARFIDGWKQT